jgi:hypothetical protein
MVGAEAIEEAKLLSGRSVDPAFKPVLAQHASPLISPVTPVTPVGISGISA